MADREKNVRACVVSPALVRESVKDAKVHLYYTHEGSGYLCVVVSPANEKDYFVVTCYHSSNMKMGKELWKR